MSESAEDVTLGTTDTRASAITSDAPDRLLVFSDFGER